jgi:ribosome-associated protein
MRSVDITKEPVELFKILKFEGLVSTGGEAKLVIADGQVSVNGERETRKRRKIVAGDIIVFADETLQVRLANR